MSTPPPSADAVQRYFDAWNRHDPEGVAAAFVDGGTYADSATGGPLSGAAIAENAASLFTSFPDLTFDVSSQVWSGERTVVVEWHMRGTNLAPVAGIAASGRRIDLPGIDVIELEGNGLRAVRGYFDQKGFLEQLGVQLLMLPPARGPMSFGTSIHVGTGRRTRPGAVSLTALHLRSDAEVAEVNALSEQVIAELIDAPGFISMFGGAVGHTMFTVIAWEDADSARQVLEGDAHGEAMARFFGPSLGQGGVTGVWTPERLSTMWVRCPACQQMRDAARPDRQCECGATLPHHPPYW
jgi:steroid delta-isomerase-like uncharacterized protein